MLLILTLFLFSHTPSSCASENTTDQPELYRPQWPTDYNNPTSGLNLTAITSTEARRLVILNMTLEAWNAYETYAWGQASLKPLTLTKQKSWLATSGTTIVGSMSTLWIMGLRKQFEKAKSWVENEMKLDERGLVKVGALLSCFALTGDRLFLDKAQMLADLFNATDLSNPTYVSTKSPEYFHQMSILREWIAQRLEYRYLSDLTGNAKYWIRIREMETSINMCHKVQDEPYKKENWPIKVKAYLQSNGIDQADLKQYFSFLEYLEESKRLRKTKTGLWYIREIPKQVFMNSRYCYFGAMLALAHLDYRNDSLFDVWRRDTTQLKLIVKHLEMSEALAEICQRSLALTRTGLPPLTFAVDEGTHKSASMLTDPQGGYALSPDLAETYFVLYRLTKNQKYREWAWNLVKVIYRYCRTSTGYALVRDSNVLPTQHGDHQPADFLSATLKYLYLIFSDETVLPLEQWVFNADGHPLPVLGKNAAYLMRIGG